MGKSTGDPNFGRESCACRDSAKGMNSKEMKYLIKIDGKLIDEATT